MSRTDGNCAFKGVCTGVLTRLGRIIDSLARAVGAGCRIDVHLRTCNPPFLANHCAVSDANARSMASLLPLVPAWVRPAVELSNGVAAPLRD